MRYLESLPPGAFIEGVLIISGFSEALENEDNQSDLNKVNSFVIPPMNLENIKNTSKKNYRSAWFRRRHCAFFLH